MTIPPSRRPPRGNSRQRREHLIVRANLRMDQPFITRLRSLTNVQAASRMVSHALSEMGYSNMALRRRVALWEGKLYFADRQLKDTKSEVVRRQCRGLIQVAIDELRKEFSNERELNEFLNRVGELRREYLKSIGEKK